MKHVERSRNERYLRCPLRLRSVDLDWGYWT